MLFLYVYRNFVQYSWEALILQTPISLPNPSWNLRILKLFKQFKHIVSSYGI
jgi:hypothetical protein